MSEEEIQEFDLETAGEEEIETKAAKMGWQHPDEFKGDPEKALDAKTFLKRGLDELPLARSNLKRLEKQNEKMERSLSQMQAKIEQQAEVLERFNDYHKKSLVKEYERGIADAQERMEQAVDEGDKEAYRAAKADADALLKNAPGEEKLEKTDGPPKPTPEQVAIFNHWAEDNPWYETKPRMAKYAYDCGEFLSKHKPSLVGADQLKEVRKMVEEEFPDYFTNPNRKRASTVDTGDKAAGAKGARKHTYNDLPDVAQKELDEFKTQIKGYTDDQYLAMYNGPWRG